ncbi:MAG TPA: hypothetical protein VK157_14295 [Phycisphaerales bacterium]|nr:hypothetical protein [Phycisphaerales bacterium]
MLQWVVLKHTLPDGTWHYDWLFEPAADAPLLTLRVNSPLRTGEFPCERLPDHRRIYLTYEGPISNNRGHVTREQQGDIISVASTPTRLTATLRTTGETYHLTTTPTHVTITLAPK